MNTTLFMLVGILALGCSAGKTVVLEELAENGNPELNVDVADLTVSLHIHSVWNNTVIQNWDHYRNAMENLKKLAPNLKTIRPSGGHSYHSRNGTLRQLRCDLLLVHNALDAITKQIQTLELKIGDETSTSINYTLFHFIDQKEFSQTNYDAILNEVFGQNVTIAHLSSPFSDKLNSVLLKYKLNGIPILLSVHTISTKSVNEEILSYGRLDHQSEKWLNIQPRLISNNN
ncbi:hypothetical protein M3Y97_00961000 [Aphelenchoides bicaudatus]|nr:hypothetical protein M3Y97_00961000 [Aphelenchoides bicaudatus]